MAAPASTLHRKQYVNREQDDATAALPERAASSLIPPKFLPATSRLHRSVAAPSRTIPACRRTHVVRPVAIRLSRKLKARSAQAMYAQFCSGKS